MSARQANAALLSRLWVLWLVASWWLVHLGRLGCWNSQVILVARFRGRRGIWDGLRAVADSLLFPFVNCWRAIRTLNGIAVRPVRASRGNQLEQVREILMRVAHAREREEASAGPRDVQKVCVRSLYRRILEAEPEDHTLQVLSLYQYAGDAMRDLLDYCWARNAMYSRAAVLVHVDRFVGDLKHYRDAERTKGTGKLLPPEGEFARERGDARHRTGPTQTLLDAYWQYDHSERLADGRRHEALHSWCRSFCDNARNRLGIHSLRAVLCHEMVVQGAKELLQSCKSARLVNRDEQLKRLIGRMMAAGESLSRTWRLPEN
jgi:hypothetical protein